MAKAATKKTTTKKTAAKKAAEEIVETEAAVAETPTAPDYLLDMNNAEVKRMIAVAKKKWPFDHN